MKENWLVLECWWLCSPNYANFYVEIISCEEPKNLSESICINFFHAILRWSILLCERLNIGHCYLRACNCSPDLYIKWGIQYISWTECTKMQPIVAVTGWKWFHFTSVQNLKIYLCLCARSTKHLISNTVSILFPRWVKSFINSLVMFNNLFLAFPPWDKGRQRLHLSIS